MADLKNKMSNAIENIGSTTNVLATHIGNKAISAIDATKTRAKLRSEKIALKKCYQNLGKHVYSRLQYGNIENDEKTLEYAQEIEELKDNIILLMSDLESIKNENNFDMQAFKETAVKAGTAVKKVVQETADTIIDLGTATPTHNVTKDVLIIEAQNMPVCPNCGTVNMPNSTYCTACDALLTQEAEENIQEDAQEV